MYSVLIQYTFSLNYIEVFNINMHLVWSILISLDQNWKIVIHMLISGLLCEISIVMINIFGLKWVLGCEIYMVLMKWREYLSVKVWWWSYRQIER